MSEAIAKRSAAVTPRGINHLVLNVRDLEESHQFWCDKLGFVQVGKLKNPGMKMRFYSGMVDGDVDHHDLALVEQGDNLPEPPEQWSMVRSSLAVNHIASTYPDRDSWLEQVQFLKDQGVDMNLRMDHGMTHSVYINDPNGYGVEVLYELPREVWGHDIDGALNYAVALPPEKLLEDDTDYVTDFTPQES